MREGSPDPAQTGPPSAAAVARPSAGEVPGEPTETDLFGDATPAVLRSPVPGLFILRSALAAATLAQLAEYAARELDAERGLDQLHLVDDYPPCVRAAAEELSAAISRAPEAQGAVALLAQFPLRQAIVNLYSSRTSQTMRTHVDLLRFGPVVLGLGVVGRGTLRFTPIAERFLPIARGGECDLAGKLVVERGVDVEVGPGSAYVMFGDARERWAHAVTSTTEGRVSLTLRGLPYD